MREGRGPVVEIPSTWGSLGPLNGSSRRETKKALISSPVNLWDDGGHPDRPPQWVRSGLREASSPQVYSLGMERETRGTLVYDVAGAQARGKKYVDEVQSK